MLFGGFDGPDTYLQDTWKWNGSSWTEVVTESRPARRWGHGMAYDRSRRVTILIGGVGIGLIGPTIAMVGTDAQKERYLAKMLLGEEIWAQGFSEPNAGSDLGSLSARAVRDGEHFIVNGQKTWTSYAHVSDWIFLLVRTDPEVHKYKGITCLLVDMKSDGVSVRPLSQ